MQDSFRSSSERPSGTEHEPATEERLQACFDRLVRIIAHIEEHASKSVSILIPAVLAQHRAELYQAVDAIGAWINDFLATNPSSSDVEAVRARIATPIRAWSAASPVFNRIVNSAGGNPRDYELYELVLENRGGGADLPALIFNDFYLHSIAAQALRNRFAALTRHLHQAIITRTQAGISQVQMLDLKCETGRELVMLADQPESSAVQITCLDEDAVALRAARARLDELLPRQVRFLRVDPLQFARNPLRPSRPYDIIYAASLFAHLTTEQAIGMIRDCYGLLTPGGALILAGSTNGIPASERILTTWLLGAVIQYRDEGDLCRLFAQTPFGTESLQFEREPLGGGLLTIAKRS